MVPGKPGWASGLISSCRDTTTGGWKTSVSHLAVRFLTRIAPLSTATSCAGALVQEERGLLQDGCDVGHEAGGQVTVHHAVVEGSAQGGDPAGNHLSVQDPGLLLDGSEGN